ncbi:hypothetical protein GJAV_G00253970 [Gymnothorax javanicus]|nr:hypothetical protein GJAV_G00253970 [Gymnothorax javanicus]
MLHHYRIPGLRWKTRTFAFFDGSGLEVQCDGEDRIVEMEQEGVSTDVPPEFPYRFDCEGRLLHRDTGGPFQCRRRGEGSGRGEAEMEALWGYITGHVYTLLEGRCGLTRLLLPPPCLGTVFLSQGALESREPLLVLIQDRGTIRSGQWSWRAAVRDGLEIGSQVGYVRRAVEERWGVILLNPNEEGVSPEEHVLHVWDRLLVKGAGPVAMVTHGYGGLAFVDLLARRPQEVMQLVRAVAFIDSVHNPWHQPLGGAARDWLRAHSRKWVLSDKPLNRPVSSLKADAPQLSAGTLSHEHAPTSCLDAVFRYITKALRTKAPPTPFNIITRSKSQGRSWPPGRGARPRLTNGGKI